MIYVVMGHDLGPDMHTLLFISMLSNENSKGLQKIYDGKVQLTARILAARASAV